MKKLKEFDYSILDYISKHESVATKRITSKFGKKIKGIELRINRLKGECTNQNGIIIWDGYIDEEFLELERVVGFGDEERISQKSYHINERGLIALQDYKYSKKEKCRQILFNNVLLPFIVAILTTITLNYFIPFFINLFEKGA